MQHTGPTYDQFLESGSLAAYERAVMDGYEHGRAQWEDGYGYAEWKVQRAEYEKAQEFDYEGTFQEWREGGRDIWLLNEGRWFPPKRSQEELLAEAMTILRRVVMDACASPDGKITDKTYEEAMILCEKHRVLWGPEGVQHGGR
jgi:hypothetical protein